MSRCSIVLATCMAAFVHIGPAVAADVGISVNVAQPGFYGRIDIGSLPRPPAVIYEQPVVVTQAPVTVVQRPIYLRVPPGHAKHWSRHCARYHACGQQTYFVQEDWYQRVYVPAHGHHHAPSYHPDGARHDRRDHDRRGERHDGKRNGHGHGHGHGRD